jgi:cytochrome P450
VTDPMPSSPSDAAPVEHATAATPVPAPVPEGPDAPGTLAFTTRTAVEAALSSPALVPPPPPPNLAAGPTADLRAAMARFGSGPAHERRRADVLRVVDGLDTDGGLDGLRSAASDATSERLTGAPLDLLADVASRVPVEVLARALGVAPDDVDEVVADVRAVVRVVGRGESSGRASDAAAVRLRQHFDVHPAGATATISVLYQAHDATAALVAAMAVSAHDGSPRRPAVSRTVRIATDDVRIAGTDIDAGTVVLLGLEDGLEFGAGPHRCPGRAVAEALAGGVLDAVAETPYRLRADLVETGPDGRPRTLPMEVHR